MKVLITGGSRGIGKAIVDKFLMHEITVIQPTRSELDLSNVDSITHYLQSINLDEVDILVNNAGVNELSSVEDLRLDELMNIFQINCNSAFMLSQALLQSFQKKQYGRIINIGSIWTERAFPLRGSYSMAKSALYAMTKMIAVENASHNILCNMISPGFIETELTLKNNSPEQLQQFLTKVPLRKMGKPSDVASLVYYLTVDNNFITGQNIFIDGGYTCSA